MELQAVIEGLTWALAHNYKAAIIVTDSKYVEQGMTQWLNQWKKNHWRTSNKGAVKNQDYWQRLDSLSQNLIVDWQWVKAHHTDSHNAYVDKLARQAAMRLPGENSCL
jgi:ribonuclease HI